MAKQRCDQCSDVDGRLVAMVPTEEWKDTLFICGRCLETALGILHQESVEPQRAQPEEET